jgi:hypothetical protein
MEQIIDTPALRARFEEKFARGAGCWNWTASKVKGYGMFMYQKLPLRAHRIAWHLYVGPVPQGMHVLHRCDNPSCVNTAHLFLGTNADNVADKLAKRRQRHGTSAGARNGRAKLTEADVRAILASPASTYALGHQYGVNPSTIGRIKKGLRWNKSAPR